MFIPFVIGVFVGSFIGTITLAILSLGSKENDYNEKLFRYMQTEEYMQRLYHIGKDIEEESPQQRIRGLCEMVGCERCNRSTEDLSKITH